jgi:protein TonB
MPMGALRSAGGSPDSLSTGQRRGVIGAIALAHVAAIWGILQVPAVREAVVEAAPIFVDLLAPPTPPAPPPPPPPPVVQPILKTPPKVVIAAAPSPAPAPFEVEKTPDLPTPPAPPVPVAVEAPPAPPAPPPPPKMIPASEVQYLVRPSPEYPRLSRRLGEAGLVVVSVYVDETGMPRTVRVSQSSGFARLDEAAVLGVQKARFKPYTQNGVPTAGWALIPFPFELEK